MSSTYSAEISYFDEDYGEGHGNIPMIGRIRYHHTSDIISWEIRSKDSVPEDYETANCTLFKIDEFRALCEAIDSIRERLKQ